MSVQTRKLIGRSLLLLVALTMIGAMLAACAPAAPAPAAQPTAAPAAEATAAPAPAAEKVQLRFVVMDYDEKMRPDTQALVDEFNASQNEIEVKLDVLGWADGEQTLRPRSAPARRPTWRTPTLQFMGQMAGINEVHAAGRAAFEGVPRKLRAVWIEAFTIDGKLIAMPYFLDPRALLPQGSVREGGSEAARDLGRRVAAAAEKLNNPPDMNAFGAGLLPCCRTTWTTGGMPGWAPTARMAIPDLWDENGKSRFNTPEGIAATQFLVDLAQKYKAVNPDFITASRDADLQPLFYNSKLAMLETGSWYPTLLKNNAPDLQVGIAAIPVAKAGMKHVTAFWPDAVMMFKQSKHPKEAAKFLEWMYGKENRLLFAKQRGVIPERIDVGADPAYAVGDTEKFFVEQLQTARNAYETPFPATLSRSTPRPRTWWPSAVAGEITAEEAMKQAAEFTDKTNGK